MKQLITLHIAVASTRRQEDVIHLARQLLTAQCPGADFDALVWDLEALIIRPGTRKGRRVYFTHLNEPKRPLPERYANVIKSWIVLEGKTFADRTAKLRTAKVLWEVIRSRRGQEAEDFAWEALTLEDLCQTELLALATWEASTAYSIAMRLKLFMVFLEARQICPPLYFTPHLPPPRDQYRHISAEREHRGRKLPSPKALEGLADIYQVHAKEPADRLRIAALALLVVSGFRAGELLTLPFACEVEEMRQGQARYGLRYYREKSKGGALMQAVRWLTPIGAELARQAVPEIKGITEPFRRQALVLEQNADRIPLPGVGWAEKMQVHEVAQVLGMTTSGVYQIAPEALPRHGRRRQTYFLAAEVAAYLLARRKQLWSLNRRDGTYQMLSETLLIVPRNFFKPSHGVNPHLIEAMNYGHIRQFLVSWEHNTSAFERFNIHEDDGSFCRMTSHQFRHWLNDIADKGGLPVDVQTRWMGRDNPRETLSYHHATVEERLQWVKAGIREGNIGGVMADVYFGLPGDEREIFLEGQIQAVHFTALGLCLHDFSIEPCPYHLNCTRGCRDYLRVKGNQEERKQLLQIRARTQQALHLAKEEASKEHLVIAAPWIRHYEESLRGIESALAIDDEVQIEEVEVVHPFEQQQSKFQPL